MPAAADKQPGDVILAAEWNTLATTANNGESGAASATTTANAASTAAAAKYTKPVGGIPFSDLASNVLAGTRQTWQWNGSAFVRYGGDGTAATSANSTAAARTPGTLRDYETTGGSPDPNALGLMIDGDDWINTAS